MKYRFSESKEVFGAFAL